MQETTNRLHRVLANLRVSCDALSDGQLLARVVTGQDEAAFAMLVRRHGPMVLGGCRRVLRHSQEIELRTLRYNAAATKKSGQLGAGALFADIDGDGFADIIIFSPNKIQAKAPSLDDAMKRLREAKSDDAGRQAIDALEQAAQRLRHEMDRTKKNRP